MWSKSLCTTSAKGRLIERNENIEATQRNKQAIENNKDLYKRRQEIVEHPFGTIKRQWGFDYTLMKGKQKVDGEAGFDLHFLSLQKTNVHPGGKWSQRGCSMPLYSFN